MPDKVEMILKKIHVLFAKSKDYPGSHDQVVISKRELFDILEELNVAIYEVLDQYEATTRSKEKAQLEMDRKAADIIAEAKRAAEDVNAAALLYTDGMVEEISDIMVTAKHDFEKLSSMVSVQLEEKLASLDENKDEVKKKLSELHDNDFYLRLLQDERKASRRLKEKSLFSQSKEDREARAAEAAEAERLREKGKFQVIVHDHPAVQRKASSADERGTGSKQPLPENKLKQIKEVKEEKKEKEEDELQGLDRKFEGGAPASKTVQAARPIASAQAEQQDRQGSIFDDDEEMEIPAYGEFRYSADMFNLDKEYFDSIDGEENTEKEEPRPAKKEKKRFFSWRK